MDASVKSLLGVEELAQVAQVLVDAIDAGINLSADDSKAAAELRARVGAALARRGRA